MSVLKVLALKFPRQKSWTTNLSAIVGVSGALLFAAPNFGFAQTASIIPTKGKVTAITQTKSGSYIETERGTFLIYEGDCTYGICLEADVIRGLPERSPKDALPDGYIASAENGDIRKAWYSQPTQRYAHGVLGDTIEGSSLVVQLDDNSKQEFYLPEAQVFEDITPRIFDFDANGYNEVITIRSSATGGSAVVIYGIKNGKLVEVAASSENGRANRWLNIVGILPNGIIGSQSPLRDGHQIVFIRTPHIGGQLSSLSFTDGQSVESNDIKDNVSNHIIGSRIQNMGAFLTTRKGGDYYVPAQDRLSLRALGGHLPDVALPDKIDKSIIALTNSLITATEDGKLLVIAN